MLKLKAGKHRDTGHGGVPGLFLLVKKDGRRSWVLRLTVNSRRQEFGLGKLLDTPLSIARVKAIEIRQRRNSGEPIRATPRGAKTTLEAIYNQVIAQRRATWTSPRSEAQWRSSFEQHCGRIRARDVAIITSKDILEIVAPIWGTKTETANRILSRLSETIRYARAQGIYLKNEDPIQLARVSLPRIKKQKSHMAAVEIDEWPDPIR